MKGEFLCRFVGFRLRFLLLLFVPFHLISFHGLVLTTNDHIYNLNWEIRDWKKHLEEKVYFGARREIEKKKKKNHRTEITSFWCWWYTSLEDRAKKMKQQPTTTRCIHVRSACSRELKATTQNVIMLKAHLLVDIKMNHILNGKSNTQENEPLYDRYSKYNNNNTSKSSSFLPFF